MTILAVDSCPERLEDIRPLLERVFPFDAIVTKSDPLVAGQYSFHHPVDVLYTALDMKLMDGLKLACFVRRASPDALTFLIVSPECEIESELWADELDGQLVYPISEESLREALRIAHKKRGT